MSNRNKKDKVKEINNKKINKKTVTKISRNFAIDAFKLLSNYCKQEAHRCSECIFRDKKGVCFFNGELLEKRIEFNEREKNGTENHSRRDRKDK